MSDISLAVGDGSRRMTYTELADASGISLTSARRLARRHHWPRQAGNDGIVRVTVSLGHLRTTPPPIQAAPASRGERGSIFWPGLSSRPVRYGLISSSMRRKTAKRDWIADWNKWSRVERMFALLFALVLLALPLSLLLTYQPQN
jgi:hypothetical protein